MDTGGSEGSRDGTAAGTGEPASCSRGATGAEGGTAGADAVFTATAGGGSEPHPVNGAATEIPRSRTAARIRITARLPDIFRIKTYKLLQYLTILPLSISFSSFSSRHAAANEPASGDRGTRMVSSVKKGGKFIRKARDRTPRSFRGRGLTRGVRSRAFLMNFPPFLT